jgi:hypothetical protein
VTDRILVIDDDVIEWAAFFFTAVGVSAILIAAYVDSWAQNHEQG